MATLALPAGYTISGTRAGYALRSPYGPLGDDFDCWAEACFAAQDHAESLALEAADELAAIADFEADQFREAA
ncbi:hypothetical protein [Methylobacterium sp. NEAU K]|uniref:hypothetical protein n=1 Tax=Methylobacterium sp. NEAU K TaxID=3064946 RepID=UPI0027372D16|nr:hypothetical protein [Methylobacterium sp. NEAU K]MDP4005112.1 hypothetical protein [Methylobacterium sp. NEAU K]